MKMIRSLLVFSLVALLAGCAAIGTAVKHRHLETQTLMSHSIFLDPVSARQKTIYVQERNTTGIQGFSFKQQMIAQLAAKGYQVVSIPSKAHYLLQVNVLRVGRASVTAAKEMMGKGYGGSLEGAAAGVALAASTGGHGMIGAGVGGAVATTIADNLVQDVNYTGLVDVRITVHKSANHRVIRQTRIVVLADQVNLDFKDAKPTLERQLANSIAGIF